MRHNHTNNLSGISGDLHYVPSGYLAHGFALTPTVRIPINDNTSLGRGWKVCVHEEPTQRMCILTEKDGEVAINHGHHLLASSILIFIFANKGGASSASA